MAGVGQWNKRGSNGYEIAINDAMWTVDQSMQIDDPHCIARVAIKEIQGAR